MSLLTRLFTLLLTLSLPLFLTLLLAWFLPLLLRARFTYVIPARYQVRLDLPAYSRYVFCPNVRLVSRSVTSNLGGYRLLMTLICAVSVLLVTFVSTNSYANTAEVAVQASLVQETAVAEAQTTEAQTANEQKVDKLTVNKQASTSINSTAVNTVSKHQKIMLEVLDDPEIVKTRTVKKWQLIQHPQKIFTKRKLPSTWLQELLERFADNNIGKNIAWLLKLMFISLLLYLIYLVIKNADKFGSFSNKIKSRRNAVSSDVSDYRKAHLMQGWENLPNHQDIPKVVRQLLADNQTLAASSILYRGSLKWLNMHTKVSIRPANTEQQCIQLLRLLQKKSGGLSANISPATQSYIVRLINIWMVLAYDNRSNLTDVKNGYAQQLTEVAEDWLQQLDDRQAQQTHKKSNKSTKHMQYRQNHPDNEVNHEQ